MVFPKLTTLGGPSFLAPLHAAEVLPAVLANISPANNHPQISLAALRALTHVAEASTLLAAPCPLDSQGLADNIFEPQHVVALNNLLAQSSPKHLYLEQSSLAASLVSRLCREERHRAALTSAGTLDILAGRLVSFAVADGFVIPGAEILAQKDGLSKAFPFPAPFGADMGPIIEALSAVVGSSPYRAHRLIHSPAILAVFPAIKFDAPDGLLDPRQDAELSGYGSGRQQDLTAMEYILPALPLTTTSKPSSASQSSFQTPEQSDSQGGTSRAPFNRYRPSNDSRRTTFSANSYTDSDELESPFIPWLIHLIRSRPDHIRGAAISILTTCWKADLGSQSTRETSLALLVVPVLVNMISTNSTKAQSHDPQNRKPPSKNFRTSASHPS